MARCCPGAPIAARIAVLAAASFLTACQGDARTSGPLVHDSAGVRIVESIEPLWGPGQGWRVAAQPELVIGVMDGADEYQFTSVRGAWRRADGTLVVADGAALEIRIFEPDGRFRSRFGGEGDGPGEFRYLWPVVPYRGDSIAAWDTRLNRISVFDEQGTLGRTVSVSLGSIAQGEGEVSFAFAQAFWGALGDGSLLFSPTKILFYELGERLLFRRPVVRFSAEGDSVGVVGTFPGAETRSVGNPMPGREALAVAGDGVWMGGGPVGSPYEIQRRGPDGTLEAVVRIPGRERPVGHEAREAFAEGHRELMTSVFGRTAAEVEEELREMAFPETLPPYSAMLVDALGHLWVAEYRHERDPRPAVWNVFDPEGGWLGPVELPARLEVRWIGEGVLVGVRTGELEVPVVEVYALERD